MPTAFAFASGLSVPTTLAFSSAPGFVLVGAAPAWMVSDVAVAAFGVSIDGAGDGLGAGSCLTEATLMDFGGSRSDWSSAATPTLPAITTRPSIRINHC